VILPDVRGLYRFYEELALRFAERGHAAVAFDYFGRTAGVEKRGDDFEYMPHVEQTTAGGVLADTRAAAASSLRQRAECGEAVAVLALEDEVVVGDGRAGDARDRRLRVELETHAVSAYDVPSGACRRRSRSARR
jgi:hypothetical protein